MTLPNTEIDKAVGQWMRRARKRKKLSEESVAAAIGVHRNTLNRWELGLTMVPVWGFIRICQHLGYSFKVQREKAEAA